MQFLCTSITNKHKTVNDGHRIYCCLLRESEETHNCTMWTKIYNFYLLLKHMREISDICE